MKLGYQTIIFGPVFQNQSQFERALKIISGAGFTGIEVMQRPDRLGLGPDPRYRKDLAPLLTRYGLTLIGLAGGTVQERVGFLDSAFERSHEPPYLYVEDWRKEDEEWAKTAGVHLALHPHYLKRVHSLEEAEPVLRQHTGVKWIPDTAHLFLAGANVQEAIETYCDRMIAVHLKDWTPEFGRVSDRYARGFVEFGRGVVHPEESLKWLLDNNYSGWVIAEQDSTVISPEESVWAAAKWLKEFGAPIAPQNKFPVEIAERQFGLGGEERLKFLEQLNDAVTRSSPEFFSEVARAVRDLYKATLVGIRAHSDWNQLLTLLARSSANGISTADDEGWRVENTLYEIPLTRLGPEVFCLDRNHPEFFGTVYKNRTFPHLELAEKLQAKWLLSIPVTNSFNANHVRFLVNVLAPDRERLLAQKAELISADIARAADGQINELCVEASARASLLSANGRGLSNFLEDFCYLIGETLGCEGCSILLQKLNGTQLTERGTTGIIWRSDLQAHEKSYSPGDGSITMEIFRRREARIYRNEDQVAADRLRLGLGEPKSWEKADTSEKECALLAPILERDGQCIGVLRCRNKKTKSGVVSFTDSDLAVIDSMLQILIPHLFVMRAEERRTDAFRQVKHEFRRPLVALNGVLDNLQDTLRANFRRLTFRKDYFGDAFSWIDLMFGLVARLEVISRGQDVVVPRPSRVNFKAIITPVVRMLRMEFEEQNLPSDSIDYGEMDIPVLRIDRNLFEQVVFNLLDNAIKYAKPDPHLFRVRIDARQEGGGFMLIFQDWGIGVDEGLKEAIFEEGIRAPEAHRSNVAGEGLGLWLVRRIVEAHDGTILLASARDPTEFRIFLPYWIADRGPRGVHNLKGAR